MTIVAKIGNETITGSYATLRSVLASGFDSLVSLEDRLQLNNKLEWSPIPLHPETVIGDNKPWYIVYDNGWYQAYEPMYEAYEIPPTKNHFNATVNERLLLASVAAQLAAD